MSLPFLSAEEVGRRLDSTAAADALEAALLAGLDPESDPPRTTVGLDRGELLVMPSAAGGRAAVKLVTVGGEPRIQGVCVVFDAETLAPAAVIDGIALTNLRTPAVSALAVRRLAIPDARRLLVFGRGPQARAHAEALSAVRPIDRVDTVGREARSGKRAGGRSGHHLLLHDGARAPVRRVSRGRPRHSRGDRLARAGRARDRRRARPSRDRGGRVARRRRCGRQAT